MDEMMANADKRLLLVDGSNLLFQMFYGMPSRIVNQDGIAYQGVLGFMGALLKIIRMTQPTHVGVLFDGEHENPRSALDADYKANRPDFHQLPEEDTPFSQLPYIYKALAYADICYAETALCEVDDWMAAYVRTYPHISIVISSFDSDFFQLISPQVSVLRYRGERTVICNPAYIREKLGIEPWQYADFKAMTGDHADNIKGAGGIGPKTAAELLRTHGDLEGIITQADTIRKPSVRASIKASSERLRHNRQLIALTPNMTSPLPFSLHELAYESPSSVNTRDILHAIGLT